MCLKLADNPMRIQLDTSVCQDLPVTVVIVVEG